MPSAVVVELPAPPPLGPLFATVSAGRLLRLTFDRPPGSGAGADRRRQPGSDPGPGRPPHSDADREVVGLISAGIACWLATGDGQFSLPPDLDAVGEFRARVYRALGEVPAGERVTYGELARRSGHPGAARAVGRAMATNPWPLVVPCHRVVPASGGIGNYAGGVARKRWMLEVEAARAGAPAGRADGSTAQAGP